VPSLFCCVMNWITGSYLLATRVCFFPASIECIPVFSCHQGADLPASPRPFKALHDSRQPCFRLRSLVASTFFPSMNASLHFFSGAIALSLLSIRPLVCIVNLFISIFALHLSSVFSLTPFAWPFRGFLFATCVERRLCSASFLPLCSSKCSSVARRWAWWRVVPEFYPLPPPHIPFFSINVGRRRSRFRFFPLRTVR